MCYIQSSLPLKVGMNINHIQLALHTIKFILGKALGKNVNNLEVGRNISVYQFQLFFDEVTMELHVFGSMMMYRVFSYLNDNIIVAKRVIFVLFGILSSLSILPSQIPSLIPRHIAWYLASSYD